MNETIMNILIVAVVCLVMITGIVKMKSPEKGSDAMASILAEIQQVVEPQAKQVVEAKKKDREEAESEDKSDKNVS
jgi:hypothetical protein